MDKRKIFVIFLLLFSVLLSSFAFYGYQVLYTPNVLVGKESRYLVIQQGESFNTLKDKLYNNHYVEDLVSFAALSRLLNYDENVKPGRYALEKDMTNLEAIRLLRSGRQQPVDVTFNNVRLISELSPKITANLMITSAVFDSALLNFIKTNEYGFNKKNVIGMFIPNTYEVYFNVSAKGLIEKMHAEYDKFWNDERKLKAADLGLSPKEVSVLASIVQAESIKADESPIIAGLYLNRLDRGIALQADPTLVFAVGDFSLKRVLHVHKEIDSPYNTYKYAGLPPGPINMPSIRSLDAVLNHKEHNYIYMCAREDFSGYHNFATNLNDHLNNARRYQRQLTIEQRKGRQQQN